MAVFDGELNRSADRVRASFRARGPFARTIVAWLLSAAAAGAAPAPQPDGVQQQKPSTLAILLLPSANLAVRRALLTQFAALAEPEVLTLAAGEPLETLVRRRCGFISDGLIELVRSRNPELGPSAHEAERTLLMPACPYWEFNRQVTAQKRGRPGALDVIGSYMGYTGPKSQAAFLEANAGLGGSLDAVHVGQQLTVPYAIRRVNIVLRSDLRDGRGTWQRFLSRFANLVVGRAGEPHEVDLVKDVSPAGLAADVPCPVESLPDGTWPFNRREVAAILEDFVKSSGTPLKPVIVVVADTGIARGDVERLPMHDNRGERGPREHNRKDDDGDRFVDNRYGAMVDPAEGPAGGFPQSDTEYDRSEHGVQVAGLAAGGLPGDDLDRVIRPVVRLSAANMVRHYSLRGGVDHLISQGGLVTSLTLARQLSAGVINWSVASARPMVGLEDALKTSDTPLAVVAAGNDGVPLDRVGGFPAGYVRNFGSRLVVVGAHSPAQHRGELIEWSNWGPETVDLLAPGCRVDTLGSNGTRAHVDGTSFAAPLVSFAAALLIAEGVEQPAQVKSRLLSTVDLNVGLEPWVRSSGSLNIAKALAVHRDVVETTDAQGIRSMSLGTVEWPTEVLSICETTVAVDALVRIAPRYAPGTEKPMLVEWVEFEEGSGRMIRQQRERCASADIAFSFQDAATKAVTPLSLGAITDLVPRRQ